MRIKYIDPISSDIYEERTTRVLTELAPDGVKIDVGNLELPPQYAGAMLSPVPIYLTALVEVTIAAEADGFDAVIIGCCSDPGVSDAQRSVDIPVIGPLQAAAGLAAGQGMEMGILFPDEHARRTTHNWVSRNLRAYGLADMVTAIDFIPMHVEGEAPLIGSTDVSAEAVEHRFRCQLDDHGIDAAKAMVADHYVDAILFGCTLWGGMISTIADKVDALCIDPMACSLEMAMASVRLRGG